MCVWAWHNVSEDIRNIHVLRAVILKLCATAQNATIPQVQCMTFMDRYTLHVTVELVRHQISRYVITAPLSNKVWEPLA